MPPYLQNTFVVHGWVAEIRDGQPQRGCELVVAVGSDRATVFIPNDVWLPLASVLRIGDRIVTRGHTDSGPMGVGATNVATELELLPLHTSGLTN